MLNAEKKTCKYNEQLCKYYEQFRVYADRILALSNDSLEKTINVALALCLVCAVLVSMATVALRPLQSHNKALDMKKNILDVAGLLENDTNIDAAFKDRIEAKLVDLATGEYVDGDVDEYDQRKAAKDPATNEVIPVEKDIASIRMKAKVAKVFLVKDAGKLQSIILPINGYGLWSTMYGFLALEADGQTVQSINLYDQGETPGLGGEVVNPNWRALWKGKKVYGDNGEVALTLVKGTVDTSRPDAVNKVDGLAGATLTSRGVSNLILYWMGPEGFAPYLNKIKSNG
ncbi:MULTISPECIES: Na(+)-translocating NADH-quinone reductase subunit C [Methylomonas]|uniref:Na(+)-translocating NADH-quinone reductase subunit C n=1 Tax=Methylomonas koyamae TaxID=702114 RepID=A0A177NN50_9GAMM|nr:MULTISPECIES: Na(+)-translocating NADH-quinone reductase subunit C [Methylomonas]NJA05582.1 Na(+)-translocating NADH-quinone reductase subunit C [Methylococcaceae bacterium WWC4]OAI19301.1 NADH:ubiquinone reductase (Na(+)-transporting) subunit C [Methylomonas koyamae]OHX37731.1 Na(+)-translocating NADH-quinone reductase subunit C [Methylomonas sp. LWB]